MLVPVGPRRRGRRQRGTTRPLGSDAAPTPATLIAATVKRYATPLSNRVTVCERLVDLVSATAVTYRPPLRDIRIR